VLAALRPHAGATAIALVGHEPSLHELASYLLTGDEASVFLEMRQGGVVCLRLGATLQPGGAALRWLVPPKVLRALERTGT
jgi:phosphohistidine phosphatase SixA